jgi:signal peptide peptidase-like protein 2B
MPHQNQYKMLPFNAFVVINIYVFTYSKCAVQAVIPSAEIEFQLLSQRPELEDIFCSSSWAAGWGPKLPQVYNSQWKTITQLTDSNSNGCDPYELLQTPHTLKNGEDSSKFKRAVMVDRGGCPFTQKAMNAQQAGANVLIVRNTREAIYFAITNTTMRNDTAIAGNTTKPPFDYDCSKGEGFVPSDRFATPIWDTDDPKCSQSSLCESQMCILTGEMNPTQTKHQVCCMWDTPILMGANRTQVKNVTIPVVFLTINKAKIVSKTLKEYPELFVREFEREMPVIDVSSVLLWVIGVATALGASYYSASYERQQFVQSKASDDESTNDPAAAKERTFEQEQERDDHTWELDSKHAIAFIVFAGMFLTIFYFFKFNGIIPIIFAISSIGSVTQVILLPFLGNFVPSLSSRHYLLPYFGEALVSEIVATIGSICLAIFWYVNRRSCWFLQDLFGISLCFMFLRTIQIPDLKVASILLCLAFLYDIFFVFISPLIFGSSVMEDVATGGPSASARSDYPGIDYCERYPAYPACIDPEPMPMLLVLPRMLNWMGGLSMLGLGDIIIPGLLLSFALRFDYSSKSKGTDYYRFMCIGYAVGLGMANIAVAWMQLGQPALMYLVPTTLGTLVYISWKKGDFYLMLEGISMEKEQKYGVVNSTEDLEHGEFHHTGTNNQDRGHY